MLAKSLPHKTLLSLSSPSSSSSPLQEFCSRVLISHFSSSSSPSHHSNSYVESRNVRVSVWWDFENCNVPVGVNVFRVAQAITAAVRSSGIKGPIQITAFGDVMHFSRANQEALSSTGINLTHIPSGAKNSADRSLLLDLMYWVSQNPPPAHLFLITGDRDFASVLHRLRMNNYNILLASTDNAPNVLYSAATIMWNWNAIVKGENLTGRHFNQPPDGPYGSWYGHYKVPLEDPFPVVERPTPSRVQSSLESTSEPTLRPVPSRVTKQISNILSSHPEGISITELRAELAKCNIGLDRDLYGHKKFSKFLFSMPHILKLKSTGDGQFLVHGNIAKAPEQSELNPYTPQDPVRNDGKQLNQSKSNGEEVYISSLRDGKLSSLPPPELKVESSPKTIEHPQCAAEKDAKVHTEPSTTKMSQPAPACEKAVEVVNSVTEDHLPSMREQDSANDIGTFEKIRRLWYGSDNISDSKCDDISKESFLSGDSKKESETVEKCHHNDNIGKKGVEQMKLSMQDDGPESPASCSLSTGKSDCGEKVDLISEARNEKATTGPGFFNQILNWIMFWRYSSNSDVADVQPGDELDQKDSTLAKHDIFSDDVIWRDIESFIDTMKGSLTITGSSTRYLSFDRKEMAKNLQEEGPLVLRSVNESDVLKFVDMMISEKKWIEEHPSEASPFRLTRAAQKNTPLGDSRASNGLSSMFRTTSHSGLSGLDGEKRMQSILDAGVSPVTGKKAPERSRHDVLADCQNLVNDVLKESPGGYHLAGFRKLFYERYGYILDVKKLGYSKLASLIQIMPGIKMEGNNMIFSQKPSTHSNQDVGSNSNHVSGNSDNELSDASKNDDESDSSWEELGPVADIDSGRKELQSSCKKPAKETGNKTYHHYEPAVSDDDGFSESDGESSTVAQSSGQVKPALNGEDNSAFLDILNSWSTESGKDGVDKDDKAENAEGMVSCSTDAIRQQDSSGQGTKSQSSLRNIMRKKRPLKSYSFVAEPDGEHKDKLVAGILGSLQKSSDSKMKA
ncbi:hypothetical protein Tsubulata_020863 [Turnera subulata]|uniref:HTH OST-type domain-containing protein n=1 Tax=Turnera subulata TaxID=218843 RepID=A0A9Q0FA81_9ROSI|nr:hypothetical protein Tsubulata_020863 [Turnera subulata]